MELKDYRFLIVDDHFLVRQMVASILKEQGVASIEMAGDGLVGLEKIKLAHSEGKPYHIVLLDWSMPQLNGYDLLLQVRADNQYDDTAIVMLTAESEDLNIVKALEAGAAAYIAKPFKPEMLVKKVGDVVAWRQKQSAAS